MKMLIATTFYDQKGLLGRFDLVVNVTGQILNVSRESGIGKTVVMRESGQPNVE